MNRTETTPAAAHDPLLLTVESARHIGTSRTSFLRDVKAGRMPQPYYLGPRRPRWRRSELDNAVTACRRGAAIG